MDSPDLQLLNGTNFELVGLLIDTPTLHSCTAAHSIWLLKSDWSCFLFRRQAKYSFTSSGLVDARLVPLKCCISGELDGPSLVAIALLVGVLDITTLSTVYDRREVHCTVPPSQWHLHYKYLRFCTSIWFPWSDLPWSSQFSNSISLLASVVLLVRSMNDVPTSLTFYSVLIDCRYCTN